MNKHLDFHPTWPAVGKALTLWAVLLLIAAILLVGGLVAVNALMPRPAWNQPPLDGMSSVSISNGHDAIRLAGESLDCVPTGDGFRCAASVESQPLIASISQGDQQAVCAATYAGEVVACRASWNNTRPFDYYAVVEDDLGLSAERFGELATQTADSGWQESDWLRLRVVLAVVAGLAAAVLLWARTRRQPSGAGALRAVYSIGAGLMVFGFVRFTALWMLLALRLID